MSIAAHPEAAIDAAVRLIRAYEDMIRSAPSDKRLDATLVILEGMAEKALKDKSQNNKERENIMPDVNKVADEDGKLRALVVERLGPYAFTDEVPRSAEETIEGVIKESLRLANKVIKLDREADGPMGYYNLGRRWSEIVKIKPGEAPSSTIDRALGHARLYGIYSADHMAEFANGLREVLLERKLAAKNAPVVAVAPKPTSKALANLKKFAKAAPVVTAKAVILATLVLAAMLMATPMAREVHKLLGW